MSLTDISRLNKLLNCSAVIAFILSGGKTTLNVTIEKIAKEIIIPAAIPAMVNNFLIN